MIEKEEGFALVLALVITALLVALATEFLGDMYAETMSHHTFVTGQQAGLMAESGAQGALQLLQAEVNTQQYTSLKDRWSQPFVVEDDRGTLEVTITDESGKLNLNTLVLPNGTFNDASYGIWLRLLQHLKLPADLGDTLADWIDANDEPHPGGAESAWYRAQLPAIEVRNGPLATVEELKLLKGFDPETLSKLLPYVTIYGSTEGDMITPVNINTAPPTLLASLDEEMSDALVQRVVDWRAEKPFARAADLASVPGMETITNRLALRIGVKGSVFRIVARATVGDTVKIVETVARLNGGAAPILYWREY